MKDEINATLARILHELGNVSGLYTLDFRLTHLENALKELVWLKHQLENGIKK